MAEATIEERQLLKSLHWWDGFVIALCNPGFLIASLGFTLATVGALGSMILWGISAMVGLLQNWIYTETATMFPDKPGGIALYAHEGWRSRFNLFGPIASFGYWIGWSVVLSLFGNLIGSLIVRRMVPAAAPRPSTTRPRPRRLRPRAVDRHRDRGRGVGSSTSSA